MARAANSRLSNSNKLTKLLILALEAVDALAWWLFTTWCRLIRRADPATAGGSNPPPPAVIGIIIAEPNTEQISLQRVANIAAW